MKADPLGDDVIKLENQTFKGWRGLLWPVRASELYKVLPLLLIKFCVSFNYTILHATKDTLTVTTKGSGAEAIPILKGSVVLIFAFLAMLFYSKLSNRLNRETLFYVVLAPFLIFFTLYAFVLYPYKDILSPHATSDWIVSIIGKEREHWVSVYRFWMNSMFFVMAELWGGIVIGLLFWGFANQINSIGEAVRFYTLFSAGGHLGIMAAGPLIWYYSHAFPKEHFDLTIKYLIGFFTLFCLVIYAAYWWTNRTIYPEKGISPALIEEQHKEERTKLSLWNSLQHIIRSPSLGCVALMVIGYSLSVNMVEVTWKATLKLKYPDPNQYQAFMGFVSSATGCFSLFLALFVGGFTIRHIGWHKSAQITPIMLGVLSLAFFAFFFAQPYMGETAALYGTTALMVVVMVGAIHNVSCKSMKYCLFDPTKEMAYIPMDEENKTKGKAAVDVVASRFGKSGSSWIQAFLIEFAGSGSILGVAAYLAPCVAIALGGWIVAVYSLGKIMGSISPKAKPQEA